MQEALGIPRGMRADKFVKQKPWVVHVRLVDQLSIRTELEHFVMFENLSYLMMTQLYGAFSDLFFFFFLLWTRNISFKEVIIFFRGVYLTLEMVSLYEGDLYASFI